jgi:hypothetical protein
LFLSVCLVAAGLYVIATRTSPLPDAGGAMRLVTWNVTPPPERTVDVDAVASSLTELGADVIALQGLTDEGQCRQVADSLGAAWRGETLPGPAGGYLAILAGPRTDILAYHLVPAGADDALALTIRDTSGLVCRVVCLNAAADVGDTQARGRYVEGILTWCSVRPSALTVLAGPIDVDAETGASLADRFLEVASSPADATELRVAPRTINGLRAAQVDQASVSGTASPPLAVDIPAR